MRKSIRQKVDGGELDRICKYSRRVLRFGPGIGKWLKNKMWRRMRYEGRRECGKIS